MEPASEDGPAPSGPARSPWVEPGDHAGWLTGVEGLREEAAGVARRALARRRLPPAPRLASTVAHLGSAVGGWWLTARGTARSRAVLAARVRRAFERLGPTYVKLAQIVSAGEGIFPAELVAEMRKCRDQVPPVAFGAIRGVVEAELGASLSETFRSFDAQPLAAASIAQVHAAELRDGTPVVVKVQRPGIEGRVQRDVAMMAWLAERLVGRIPVAALANPPGLVEVFAETIVEELDFRLEAAHMLEVAGVLAAMGQDQLVVPRPHRELVTRRVLVMERLFGLPWGDGQVLRQAGVDPEAALRVALVSLLEGAMVAGVFHGDLHGGNLVVLRDGRVGLLDFGITGRLGPAERRALVRLLLAVTTNDVAGQVEALQTLGALPADRTTAEVIEALGLDRPPLDPLTVSVEELVAEVRQVVSALLGLGARLPKALVLFVKDLVFLDGALAAMAPDLDVLAEVVGLVRYFQTRHGAQLAADLGMDPAAPVPVDLAGVAASFGAPGATSGLTVAELNARRREVRTRLEAWRSGGGRGDAAERS
ncbi:ABC1 kinase family protein [Aciditerrimonas ferrireducens]|uniref:ABC1 kinase family protein n=1 Tax=Aciditerrimonas ferrireducens TaxID=667306 RepID=A0ABV6C505_9ACTN